VAPCGLGRADYAVMVGMLIDAVRYFQRHFEVRESNRRQEF
jgi:hypothetical protein